MFGFNGTMNREWVLASAISVGLAIGFQAGFPLIWIPFGFGLAVSLLALTWSPVRDWSVAPRYFSYLSTGTILAWLFSNGGVGPWIFYLYAILAGFWVLQTSPEARWLVFAAALAFGVGYLSGPTGGANWMVEWVQAQFQVSPAVALDVIHNFRKTFHFCFYGTSALVWSQGLRRLDSASPNRPLLALGLVLCMASMDEVRQHFVPNRTGSPWDVLLDLSGAVTFLAIWHFARPNAR